MNRRVFLAGALVFGSSILTACTTTTPENTVPTSSPTPPPSQPRTTAAPVVPAPPTRKVLLAYFSRAGENYYYGGRTTLTTGNTQVVADMIAETVTVDVYRIEAADPYPDDYEQTVARNSREEDENARPAIANPLPDLAAYDTVLLGSPVWNVQTPMIMRTFAENSDLAGKTIHPFVTFAVSNLGRVVEDYTALCPNSTIGEALAIQGEQATDAQSDIRAWLQRIGLIAG